MQCVPCKTHCTGSEALPIKAACVRTHDCNLHLTSGWPAVLLRCSKPANFLVVDGVLKLSDFGISEPICGDTSALELQAPVSIAVV